MSVLLNTQATSVTIKHEIKLGYVLPLNTEHQGMENLKRFKTTECPLHARKDCILKRTNELKSFKNVCSMKSGRKKGANSKKKCVFYEIGEKKWDNLREKCASSIFPEGPTDTELANKPVPPEVEHLKIKQWIRNWTPLRKC